MLEVDMVQFEKANPCNFLVVIVLFKVVNDGVTLLKEEALVLESVKVLHVSLEQFLESLEHLLVELLDKSDQGWKDLLLCALQERVNITALFLSLDFLDLGSSFRGNDFRLKELHEASQNIVGGKPDLSVEEAIDALLGHDEVGLDNHHGNLNFDFKVVLLSQHDEV
jgi:hypothetical protein